jgi:hypothetical protein
MTLSGATTGSAQAQLDSRFGGKTPRLPLASAGVGVKSEGTFDHGGPAKVEIPVAKSWAHFVAGG